MAELNQVIDAVCETLENEKISAAVARYPLEKRKRYTVPIVTVGLKSGEGVTPGFAEYLGERFDKQSGKYVELYGKRLELSLALHIYAPGTAEYGPGHCLKVFGEVTTALAALPEGMRVRKLTCEETVFDHSAELFCCACTLETTAFLYAEKTEENMEFLDFILRGVLKN